MLSHGGGGEEMNSLINETIFRIFDNEILRESNDSAILNFSDLYADESDKCSANLTPKFKGKLAFSTDSFVVTPIFFNGGDIGKITFTESTMDVYGKDSDKIDTFSLSDITKLFFSDKEGNVTEINPDGALKFAKTGNTLKVDGLSAATDAFIVSASGRIVMQQKQWDGNSLDISSLTDGVYILAVGNAAFKFIKQ